MSQFEFLKPDWLDVFEAAEKACQSVHYDPRTSCFYSRRALELAVAWVYRHDNSVNLPYQDNLSALIHEPTFKTTTGEAVFNKAKVITQLGNTAVHSQKSVRPEDALASVKELFHVAYWLVRTYSRSAKPLPHLIFNPNALPKTAPVPKQTIVQLQELESRLTERDEKLSALLSDKSALDEELKQLRAEVAEIKKQSAAQPDEHDYSEAETRDYYIDLLLKETGWSLDRKDDREYAISGMPNTQEKGYVDYVLWGVDGKPLALIEAKRTKRDPRVGQQQAKLYADCLEKQFGQRPIIFYSNGYEHWMWDDTNYPPRQVQGFYKRAELERLIQRRTSQKSLAKAEISKTIVERYYQTRSIRRISEAFEQDKDRKALVVMATGAGKTRTVIALCDLLTRCNWAKRVLFLADRVALVNQAVKAFKSHLPDVSPVNLVTEKNAEGRVFVSTYPTMMSQINEMRGAQRRFGVGHFDLVIIDEAHRSVFQKYRAIFDYFDSLLVGLTATPKDEIDRNTYSLFDLENGVPTDAYSLEEAVNDRYLVPPKPIAVPLKFQREGIKYDQLPEDEKDQWDTIDWDDEGNIPDKIDSEALNKWLFNIDTVDKVLAHLMTRGLKVAGGDRLGKTIVFAKNQAHAEFISERFNINYPNYKGEFARVITFKTEYAQNLIDDFSDKAKAPHIALSVDMLDTGIDVPEVVNLVFFKRVHSKTKFWQMLGRGTRLCPDLFGPGEHKQFFYILDYCMNLEFFTKNPKFEDGSLAESLGKKLFMARLEMIGELDKRLVGSTTSEGDELTEAGVRQSIADLLYNEVAAMNLDNFVVRPKRRFIEKYNQAEVWQKLSLEALVELAEEVAGLPSELDPEAEESKRFDMLMLYVQLAYLRCEPGFQHLCDEVKKIAGLLEEMSAIPMVQKEMVLIQDIQTDEWWQDVTIPMLEIARRRLRSLVQLIEKKKRKPIYTNFEDLMGDEREIELPGFLVAEDFERFRDKARAFLREHQDNTAIHKLRSNKPMSLYDIAELERLLVESGTGSNEAIKRAKDNGLGVFVRSLVGLDREAAKQALSGFLDGKKLGANQIEFVNMIVEHLTEHGVMNASLLYESPFTDITPQGPEGIFTPIQVTELVSVLGSVYAHAAV